MKNRNKFKFSAKKTLLYSVSAILIAIFFQACCGEKCCHKNEHFVTTNSTSWVPFIVSGSGDTYTFSDSVGNLRSFTVNQTSMLDGIEECEAVRYEHKTGYLYYQGTSNIFLQANVGAGSDLVGLQLPSSCDYLPEFNPTSASFTSGLISNMTVNGTNYSNVFKVTADSACSGNEFYFDENVGLIQFSDSSGTWGLQ